MAQHADTTGIAEIDVAARSKAEANPLSVNQLVLHALLVKKQNPVFGLDVSADGISSELCAAQHCPLSLQDLCIFCSEQTPGDKLAQCLRLPPSGKDCCFCGDWGGVWFCRWIGGKQK